MGVSTAQTVVVSHAKGQMWKVLLKDTEVEGKTLLSASGPGLTFTL